MKHLSIKLKITLWFSAALILVVGVTYYIILLVSNQIIQKTIKDNLIETVENNVDEVEYFHSLEEVQLSTEIDSYLHYKEGFLEIDDDFLNEVNKVYTSLCQSDSSLLYGENPIAKESASLSFIDSSIQTLEVGNTLYYIFDRKLTKQGLEGLWLRGVVSEVQGEIQLSVISRTSLLILPLLVIIAILGGYLIARRTLRPIQRISESALKIQEGGDLKERIHLGKGNDELHQLANHFNTMFERLDFAFQKERQFTSDVSHELRTPMTVILAQCELLSDASSTFEDYKEGIQLIERQGKKMSGIINVMLDFSRMESGSDKYKMEMLDFSELVSVICEDMKLIQDKNITLEFCVESGISIWGNYELLTRLLQNLISNSYRYGNLDGKILVSLKKQKDFIFLSVEDNGIGIAKDEQEKIFQRFYQSDSSHSGVGVGLGLPMVLEITKFHKGTVEVESTPGVGSIFTCIFKNISF